jgi:hypothetical protein
MDRAIGLSTREKGLRILGTHRGLLCIRDSVAICGQQPLLDSTRQQCLNVQLYVLWKMQLNEANIII